MTHHAPEAAAEIHPPDIAKMRESVSLALALTVPPTAQDIRLLLDKLRGHLELLLRDVEQQALSQRNTMSGTLALACVAEARRKLSIKTRPTVSAQLAYGRRLARVLAALCDHYERLGS